jgi:hypothetical protein
MKRPILIGTPEVISLIPETIQRMLENEGLYIGSNPASDSFGEAPLVSMGGKIYSLTIDSELDPTRFIEGHRIDGPFRAGRDADHARPVAPDLDDNPRIPAEWSREEIARELRAQRRRNAEEKTENRNLRAKLAEAHKALMVCDGAMMGKVKPSSVAFKMVGAILRPENEKSPCAGATEKDHE